jgi:hypothetical protein
MRRVMLTCFSVVGLCGLLGVANAAPANQPVPVTCSNSTATEQSHSATNAQGQNQQDQLYIDPDDAFLAVPLPNAGYSPNPAGS